MKPFEKSCGVALPKGCNYATSTPQGATPDATHVQPAGLKALASAVLERNSQRNSCATPPQQVRNFTPENDPQKLQSFSECNQATRPPIPVWCNTRCGNYHRLEIPGLDVVQGCYQETDALNWRWDHINKMKKCPKGKRD